MKIKTLDDLARAICDTADVDDGRGNLVSPKLVIVDDLGNEYVIDDLFIGGDKRAVIKIDGGGQ